MIVQLFGGWYAIMVRRNRRELAGIIVLLGVLGGVSLFALAGARRTQSSFPRFLRASSASTMAIDYGQYDPAITSAIAARPEVLRSTTYIAFTTGPLVNGRPDFAQAGGKEPDKIPAALRRAEEIIKQAS